MGRRSGRVVSAIASHPVCQAEGRGLRHPQEPCDHLKGVEFSIACAEHRRELGWTQLRETRKKTTGIGNRPTAS